MSQNDKTTHIGSNMGRGVRSRGGRGRMIRGLGPTGFCVCNKCGYRKEHSAGTPCMEMKCPKCNIPLVREGGYHDRRIRK